MADIFRAEKNLTDQQIYNWLLQLREHSYVPASGYAVASIVKAECAGQVFYFGGANQEYSEYSLSTHGEDGAVAAMVTALGPAAVIHEGWVMGAPAGLSPDSDDPYAFMYGQCCGRCRQRVAGFASSDNVVMHSVSLRGDIKDKRTGDMLPDSFSFADYKGNADRNNLKAAQTVNDMGALSSRLYRTGPLTEDAIKEWIQALSGVSYASGIEQNMVLQLANGAYVAGVKVEDAAFTGINAVQAALAQAGARLKDVRVQKAYIFCRNAEGTKTLPDDAIVPLSFSARQALYEKADSDIDLIYFSASGKALVTKLFEKPYARFTDPFIMIE